MLYFHQIAYISCFSNSMSYSVVFPSRMRILVVSPPPLSGTTVHRAKDLTMSQSRHIVLSVTSSATPLTKEGNKHSSRKEGHSKRKRSWGGGVTRGDLNPPNLSWHGGQCRWDAATAKKRTLPGREPVDFFFFFFNCVSGQNDYFLFFGWRQTQIPHQVIILNYRFSLFLHAIYFK